MTIMSSGVQLLLLLSLATLSLSLTPRLERVKNSFPGAEFLDLSEKLRYAEVPTEGSDDEAIRSILEDLKESDYLNDLEGDEDVVTTTPGYETVPSNPTDPSLTTVSTSEVTTKPTDHPTFPPWTGTTKSHNVKDNFKYFISPGLASDKSSNCYKHSEIYYNELLKTKKAAPWALQMLDSSGNFPPSGIYYGNIQSPGNWEECVDIRAHIDEAEYPEVEDKEFSGKNCRTYYRIIPKKPPAAKPSGEKPQLSELEAFLMSSIFGGKMFRGVCVPSSCSHEDVQMGTNRFISAYGMVAVVTWKDCDVQENDIELTKGDIAMIALLSAMGLILVIATLLDVLQREQKKRLKKKQSDLDVTQVNNKPGTARQLVTHFSVLSNVEKIFTVKKGELDCVHGIRFFSMSWVILAHTYTAFTSTPSFNIEGLVSAIEQFMLQVIFNGSMCVDTFFFLSGFLVAYVFFRSMRKGSLAITGLLVLKGYVYRFLRLTPAYAWTIGIAATIFFHFGSGPYWKSVTWPMVEACQDKWWTNIIYLNNFIKIEGNLCLDQAWYLAVDMQFFLVAPLLMVPLLYNKKLGFIWFSLVTAGSIVVPAVTIYKNDSPPGVLMFNVQSRDDPDFLMNWYAKPYNRFTAYLVGILSGYLFVNKPKKPILNRPLALLGWFLATGVGVAVVFGLYRPQQFYGTYSHALASLYGCFHKLAWSLCIAWVIFACTQGYGGPVNSFLSSSAFIPLARMSYCSYLVALHIQKFYSGTRKIPVYFDHVYVMYSYFGHLIFTHLVALIFTVCFESPFLGLTKILLEGGGGQRRKPETEKPVEATKANTDVEGEPELSGSHESTSTDDDSKSTSYPKTDSSEVITRQPSIASQVSIESETSESRNATEGHTNNAFDEDSETDSEDMTTAKSTPLSHRKRTST